MMITRLIGSYFCVRKGCDVVGFLCFSFPQYVSTNMVRVELLTVSGALNENKKGQRGVTTARQDCQSRLKEMVGVRVDMFG